jgi:hypothetical protein
MNGIISITTSFMSFLNGDKETHEISDEPHLSEGYRQLLDFQPEGWWLTCEQYFKLSLALAYGFDGQEQYH